MKHRKTRYLLTFLLLAAAAGLCAAYFWARSEIGYSVIEQKGWKVVYRSLSYDRAFRKYEKLNADGTVVIMMENYTGNTIIPW